MMVPIFIRVITIGITFSQIVACGAPALTTILSGRHDEVIISTTPERVSIYDSAGKLLAITPAKVTIARKDSPLLYLHRDGFRDTTLLLKPRLNRLLPVSIVPAVVVGGLSFQGAPDGKNFLPWLVVASTLNLIWCHLPDYFLGGAYDHKKEIAVVMQKEDVSKVERE